MEKEKIIRCTDCVFWDVDGGAEGYCTECKNDRDFLDYCSRALDNDMRADEVCEILRNLREELEDEDLISDRESYALHIAIKALQEGLDYYAGHAEPVEESVSFSPRMPNGMISEDFWEPKEEDEDDDGFCNGDGDTCRCYCGDPDCCDICEDNDTCDACNDAVKLSLDNPEEDETCNEDRCGNPTCCDTCNRLDREEDRDCPHKNNKFDALVENGTTYDKAVEKLGNAIDGLLEYINDLAAPEGDE